MIAAVMSIPKKKHQVMLRQQHRKISKPKTAILQIQEYFLFCNMAVSKKRRNTDVNNPPLRFR